MTPKRKAAGADAPEDLVPALSSVFSLLSEVFLEPEADVKVRLGEVLAFCPVNCPGLEGLPKALQGMIENCEPPNGQAMEFVRLFLHGNGNATVHPYESVYTHGHLMAPECLDDWRALHEEVGIHPRGTLHVPPDHLGLELEFLAYVLSRIASEGDHAESQRVRAAAETALRRHLVPFSRRFVARLSGAGPSTYYASAGAALVEGLHACVIILGLSPDPAQGSPANN